MAAAVLYCIKFIVVHEKIKHYRLGGSSQMIRSDIKKSLKAVNKMFSYPLNAPPSSARRQIVLPS